MTSQIVEFKSALMQLLPSLILIAGGCLLICSSLVVGKTSRYSVDEKRTILGWIAAAFLIASAGFHCFASSELLVADLFRIDATKLASERLALIGGFVILLLGWSISPKNYLPEYYGCILLILGAIPIVGAADDMIVMFLALELVSIPTYILLSIARAENPGVEAALKYFMLSAFASCFFLLGLSYLYGLAGTMDITAIQATLAEGKSGKLGLFALILVICGLCFRITAVPFHFYGPDVFEGTSLLMASIMSYLPKVAGFIALVRILDNAPMAAAMTNTLIPIILVIAAITMTVGNVMASAQTGLRRILGYSSIAHTGYLLLALAAIMVQGAEASVIFTYLAAYAVMTLGVFAAMAEVDEAGGKTITVGDLSSLFYRRPAAAIAMSVCLISLIGLPITAGFVAKLQIFFAAGGASRWDMSLVTLLMAINAVVAAGYYFKLLSKLYERGVDFPPLRLWRPSLFLAYSVCAVLTIVWAFQPTAM